MAGLLLLSFTTPPARAATPDKVVFAWSGPITVGAAPLAFAQQLGLFNEANIDFEIVTLDGSGTIIPQLLNGSVFSGFLTYDPLIISRAPGKPNFDYKFVYNSVRNSMWEISVLDTSPIHSIKDLAGKTIGVGALSFGNISMNNAILKQQGVDPAGVTFVPVGTGVRAFQALRSGKIDAMNLFDVAVAEMRALGTKIRLVPLPSDFDGISSHGYPVTNATIRDHPDLVGRFGRVAAEGTVACIANPRGCLLAYWKSFPNSKPAGDEAAALAETLPILQVRLEEFRHVECGRAEARWGVCGARDLSTWVKSLAAGGLIPDANIDLNTLYTNQFVAQYNSFDRGAIARRATAYRP